MIYNNLFGIYCSTCNKYLNPRTEVNLINESILCLKCDNIVGYTHDQAWKELFEEKCSFYYDYHHKGHCRCTQEETDCLANIDNCKNLLAKKSYEQDIEEENDTHKKS